MLISWKKFALAFVQFCLWPEMWKELILWTSAPLYMKETKRCRWGGWEEEAVHKRNEEMPRTCTNTYNECSDDVLYKHVAVKKFKKSWHIFLHIQPCYLSLQNIDQSLPSLTTVLSHHHSSFGLFQKLLSCSSFYRGSPTSCSLKDTRLTFQNVIDHVTTLVSPPQGKVKSLIEDHKAASDCAPVIFLVSSPTLFWPILIQPSPCF